MSKLNPGTMYITYITIYSGNLLPPFYVGSTSLSKAASGYRGSVSSQKWRKIFLQELQENPDLFSLLILSCHVTRKEALSKELELQKLLNVVKSPLFFNESLATKNGCYGRTGPLSSEHKLNLSINNGSKRAEVREKMSASSKARKNRVITEITAEKIRATLSDYQHAHATKEKRAVTMRENARKKFMTKLMNDGVDASLWEEKLANYEQILEEKRLKLRELREKANKT